MSIEYKGLGAVPEVKIGRLQKKISKLIIQMDYWKNQHDHYKKVIDSLPSLEQKYNRYLEMVVERKRVVDLEKRVQEQALLIANLTSKKT